MRAAWAAVCTALLLSALGLCGSGTATASTPHSAPPPPAVLQVSGQSCLLFVSVGFL